MVSAQEWINEVYPKENRSSRKYLIISWKNLEGPLDLTSFPKLSFLNANYNHITEIILPKRFEGTIEIHLSNNRLESLYFLEDMEEEEKKKVIHLDISDNNFFSQDLSFLEGFVSLIRCILGNFDEKRINEGYYNRFFGSLEPLKEMKDLNYLSIDNLSEIRNDWYHLSYSLRWFSFSSEIIKNELLEKMLKDLIRYVSITYNEELKLWKIDIEKAEKKSIDYLQERIIYLKSENEALTFVNSILN